MQEGMKQDMPEVRRGEVQREKKSFEEESKIIRDFLPENFEERKKDGIRIHVDFDRLLAADLEWVMRIADYALQDVIYEERFFEKGQMDKWPRVGRYFTPLSEYSFEIQYTRTERSIDIFLILGEIILGVASSVAYDILKKVFQRINERTRNNNLPLKSKATESSLKERRIKSIRISRVEKGEVIEKVEIIETYQ